MNLFTRTMLKMLLGLLESWLKTITADQIKKIAVYLASKIPDYKWCTNDMQQAALERELTLVVQGTKAIAEAAGKI